MFLLQKQTNKQNQTCPCVLNKDEVRFLHSENQVLLVGGICQNPLADDSEGICGKPLGAHPLAQGDHLFDFVLLIDHIIAHLNDFMI